MIGSRSEAYLWVEREVFVEFEGAWIIFVVVPKLLTLHKVEENIDHRPNVSRVGVELLTSRMSILSSHRRTSGPSSFSDLAPAAAERERERERDITLTISQITCVEDTPTGTQPAWPS